MPFTKDIDITGIKGFDTAKLEAALAINVDEWKKEVIGHEEHFVKLYTSLPKELLFQKELLTSRL